MEETRLLGLHLGRLLKPGDIVCFSGDLGAGKTTLAAGIGQGWNAEHALTSPTFVMVHRHERTIDHQFLYHLDMYRIQSPADAESIGLDDILDGSSAVLIEWAENIRDELPPDVLWVTLTDAGETARQITITAAGERSHALLESLRQRQEQ